MNIQKNNNEILQNYRNLPANMKIIIQILAIQVSEIRQQNILSCLNLLGINDDNNQPLVLKTFRPLLAELENKKLIIKKPIGIICVEPLLSEAFQDTVKENQFEKIASSLLELLPLSKNYKGYYFKDINEYHRAIKIAVYSDNKLVDIDTAYNSWQWNLPIAYKTNSPFLKLLNRPFNPDLLQNLSLSTQFKILDYLLDDAGKTLEPIEEVINYYLSILRYAPDETKQYRIMQTLFICGRINEHQAILSECENQNSALYLAHTACIQMLMDDNKEALVNFNKALSAIKKSTRKRKIFLTGYSGLFFLFALIKSDKPEDHQSALSYIDIAVKNNNDYSSAMKTIKTLFQEKLGLSTESNNLNDRSSQQSMIASPPHSNDLVDFHINYNHPIYLLLNILVLSWVDSKNTSSYIPVLEKLRKNSSLSGYLWLEAEFSALLATLGNNKKANEKRSKDIHKEFGTTSLTTIVMPTPRWEKNLNSLVNIGKSFTNNSTHQANQTSQTERLIWLLFYNDKYNSCYILPRLQKMTKKGSWTNGRSVALKNLYMNYHTMNGLSEQDQRVCSTIVEESYRNGYNYYRQVEYNFDEEKALPALVGHPFLFFEDSLNSPVELVMGEPEVRLRMDKGQITITINPNPKINDSQISIVRETPSRFKLVRFSAEHLKIADILGENGLELPPKAKQMAGMAMASLSSHITVHSDLAASVDESVQEIKADASPHIHLMPWQQGLIVEFLVRPFSDKGSYFKPGHGGSNVYAEVNGVKVQATRDLKQEKTLEKSIINQCHTLDLLEEVGGQWLVDNTEDALELLLELKNCSEPVVLKWPQGETMKIRSQVSLNDFKLKIKKERDWFKATGTLNIDENLAIDLTKLMTLLEQASDRFIVMDDGTFLAITSSLKERLEELKAYSTPCKDGVHFTPLVAPAIEELSDQVGSLESDNAWKEHCKKLKEIVKPEIPGTLKAKLRDYQATGFNWLAQLSHWNLGACLADDMGLGKTVQAIAAILQSAVDGPSLVIAPLSVMNNWQDECNKFAPTLNPVFFGSGDRQSFLDELGPFDLVISSYGLLQVEAEKLAGVNWQTLVLDEAQAIKNMQTKRSKAAMKLNAKFRIITTGTPVENHLSELWTLFNFINPGLLGTLQHFNNTFAIPIERDHDKKASRRLQKLIQPFILRRMKTDVLKELPEKTEITLQIEMSRDESILYEAQRLKAIENIEKADGKPGQKHLQILAELTKLRQLCCNPSLVLPNSGVESSKLKVFGDMVDELLDNNHKVLVFSQFVGHLSILRKFLDNKKIVYQYLDGSTPVKKRMERIKAFQNGVGDLFLISLKAGGFGLNLTAADYVIHMDPWWNPAVEDQASDRAHRIGQTRPVTIYRMVVKDSIEQQIINLHKEKRELAQSLLEGSDMSGKVSAEDLLALLHETVTTEEGMTGI